MSPSIVAMTFSQIFRFPPLPEMSTSLVVIPQEVSPHLLLANALKGIKKEDAMVSVASQCLQWKCKTEDVNSRPFPLKDHSTYSCCLEGLSIVLNHSAGMPCLATNYLK